MPKSFPSPTISPMNHHHHPPSAFPKPPETLAPPLSPEAGAVDHDLRLHESLLMGAQDGVCHPSALQALAPTDSFSSFFHHADDLEDDDDDDPEDEDDEDISAPPADQRLPQLPLQIDPASSSALLVRAEDFAGVSREGNSQAVSAATSASRTAAAPWPRIDPTPHISAQFYTFNRESHELMLRCILEGRLATPDEIRVASPRPVLKSWRSVWKDRNEDTAYLTAWKRLQDKLHAAPIGMNPDAPSALSFKSNQTQRISHVDQWQDIVTAAHADPDLLRHLGLKDTVDRIKQSWTVGAKLYGLPESFIRVCVASCPVCSSSTASATGTAHQGSSASLAAKSKRRRFEYTESFDVPAKDVQRQLQQLAAKHKVVLCIRQKYIRYKPFMAEVKDYACHRAGEPSSASASAKKARVLKREPYQSKRCGCGFRIRAIVPITNYNDKDKTFVYQEEGTAVFKLYAVHSGHEPGPLDGNARIIHRMVGNKGFFEFDQEVVYGVREDMELESLISLMGNEDTNDLRQIVLQQVQEIKNEAGFLGCKISKIPSEVLGSLSLELLDILNRLRSLNPPRLEHQEEGLIIGEDEVPPWGGDNCHQLARNNRLFSKDAEMIEDDDADFGSSLGSIVAWDNMGVECQDRKMLLGGSLKTSVKWMKEDCTDFDEKSILNCGEDEEVPKLIKPLTDPSLVGMQVDGFYSDSTKWYDSPSGLDASMDSGDDSYRHGGLV